MSHAFKFNRLFIRDFWMLCAPYWQSNEKRKAILLLIVNILCIVMCVGSSLALNQFYKYFYDALQAYNQSGVAHALYLFAFILASLIISYGYAGYFNGLLSLHWRQWLTQDYIHQSLYHKNLLDNPDQRIADDIELFTDNTLSILFAVINAALTLTAFSIVLWCTAHTHASYLFFLFLGAIAYTILGTLITHILGRKLSHLDYREQQYHADFRYALIKARELDSLDNHQVLSFFSPIFSNKLAIINIKKRLTFFTSGYNTLAYLLGILLLTPLFLHKQIQLGDLMLLSGAFASIIGAASVLISVYFQLTDWRATIHRLAEFSA